MPVALLCLAYLPILYELVLDWYHDDNYSHGFLVPLVSFYLLWSQRGELQEIRRQTSLVGLAVFVGALVLMVLGTGAAEYFTVRASFVVALFGLVFYLYGWQLARNAWFAFFFLLFMIPIPYVLYYSATFPMQILASKITVAFLESVGIAVMRQGNIIHLQETSLEVAEACSGLRSLVSLLALGALFAYLTQRRFSAQAIMFLSTIPIAVVANVFRVVLTASLVSTVGLEVTAEPLHTVMGLSVFVFSFICLAFIGVVLGKVFSE